MLFPRDTSFHMVRTFARDENAWPPQKHGRGRNVADVARPDIREKRLVMAGLLLSLALAST
jgi:hypothetical protein